MGVLNVTPDSFSDGGDFLDPGAATRRLGQMAAEGAAICDVGAESTRPGAEPVPAAEQLRRLAPVFAAMSSGRHVAVSIDTSSAPVADAAIRAGAVLVNDVTAGRGDGDLLPAVADRGAAVCLVHMKGEPRTMQADPDYDDVVREVRSFLEERLAAATGAGIPERNVLLDPGIGFGKRRRDNLALLRHLGALRSLGRPILIGASRKSFIGEPSGPPPGQRLEGSLAAEALAIVEGADIIRAHDVLQAARVARLCDAVLRTRDV